MILRWNHPLFLMAAGLLFVFAGMACEGPEGPQGPEGPRGAQGEQGPQGPRGPAGVDGNANVTRYIFEGHDFSSDPNLYLHVEGVSEQEMNESTWQAFLIFENPLFGDVAFHVPGFGFNYATFYQSVYVWDRSGTILSEEGMLYQISVTEGPGETYKEIHLVRIEQSEVIDAAKVDLTDYQILKDYFEIPK